MKITIIGGGPGGLFLASLVKERHPGTSVRVYERNAPEETFGFGVVFSGATLSHLRENDRAGFDALFSGARQWPGIEIHRDEDSWSCGGIGFSAIERRLLLRRLSERTLAAGVGLEYDTEVLPGDERLLDADIVVAADGANSRYRDRYTSVAQPSVSTSTAKFIWFGTTARFSSMTFLFERTQHGWFAAHVYPFNDQLCTFVVETDAETWHASGLDAFDVSQAPGPSDEASAQFCQALFSKHLGDGTIVTNNSRWASFRTLRNRSWQLDNRTVLLGDAAHTAHFSVGSGTKMAMEDALELAGQVGHCLAATPVPDALRAYESVRRPSVERIQSASVPSLRWWENFGIYAEHLGQRFPAHFLTRSGRVGVGRLETSDPGFVASVSQAVLGTSDPRAVLRESYSAEDMTLPRVVHASLAPDGLVVSTEGVEYTIPVVSADSPAEIDDAVAAMPPQTSLIAVVKGRDDSTATQQGLAEQLRLTRGAGTVLVMDRDDEDAIVTTLFAGRADVVAVLDATSPVSTAGVFAGSAR